MTGEELALEIRKLLLIEGNISETQAAKLIGMSQQNFSQKLKSGTLRYSEVNKLLNALGYEITWNKTKSPNND
ncbi:phosphoribosylglycinamide formyltransferase [Anaerosinus massiliensis]|uniref:phosphoribosylglycinamide formyltransferase n=1 Tax=Massilibacillus massiliensis TaxID=1806837 RepID=UPI000DA628A4|nr:phosphoribosylglycinamide formyltransferase [Massilibacillus massiliensis]